VAAGTFSGAVQLWNARTGQPIGPPVIQDFSSTVESVSFGSSPRTLTAVDGVGNIRRWTAGKGVMTLKPSGFPATLSGDGSVVVAATKQGGFSAVTVPEGRQAGRGARLIPADAEAIAVSLDGKRVAVGARGQVVVSNLAGRQMARLALGTAERIRGLTLNRDGRFLAVVTEQTGHNTSLQIWDTSSKVRLGAPLDTRIPGLLDAAMAGDGGLVATARGGDVLLWNSNWGPAFASPLYITEQVVNAVASHDGRQLAFGDQGGRVGLINIKARKILRRVTVGPSADVPQPIGFSPAGDAIAASSGNDTRIASLTATGPDAFTVPGGGLAFSPDGTLFASVNPNGSRGDVIQVYDRASRRPRGDFQAVPVEERMNIASSFPQVLSFSPDGRFVFAGGMGGVAVWPVDGSAAPRLLRYDKGTSERFAPPVKTMTFTPDGKTLVVGAQHGAVVAWDWRTGRRTTLDVPTQDRGITALAFSPTEALLALGESDGAIQLFDLKARQLIGSPLPGPHTENLNANLDYFNAEGWGVPVDVRQLVFIDDGRSLLAVNGDSTTVWQLDSTAWEHHACAIAGRTLTNLEWAQLLPGQSYNPACRDGRLNSAA